MEKPRGGDTLPGFSATNPTDRQPPAPPALPPPKCQAAKGSSGRGALFPADAVPGCAPTLWAARDVALGTQALGSKREHRASQGDPVPQGWCPAWPFAGSQGASRAAACSDPAPVWPTGARLQASPREQAHCSLAAKLKKGLFRSFPTGLVISLLLLRGKIPQGRRLVANQAAETMAVKSEASSPRHLLLLAGLAPPIPTSSAHGAHPNLTGWAGTTGPDHCKAALVGPRIQEEHPLPAGVRVAAPQQGQPRLPTPLP